MSNVAREMVRAYFGIVESGTDRRLQKIRELRARDEDAVPRWKRASTAFFFKRR
jgi:hypothetical protein